MGDDYIKSINEIDTNILLSLKESNEYYSYPKLCELLNLKKCGGTQKQAQMRKLSSICTLEKIGTKYRILDIEDNRSLEIFNQRSIYVPYIELMLMNYFYLKYPKEDYKDIPSIFLTPKEIIINVCDMVNKNYIAMLGKDGHNNSLLISAKYQLDSNHFSDFIEKGYLRILYPIVDSALKSMQHRLDIKVETGIKLYKNHREQKMPPTYTYILTSSELGEIIFQQEGNFLTELSIENDYDIYGKQIKLKNEFFNKCNSYVKEQSENNEYWKQKKWDFDGYYKCKVITLNTNRIKANIPMIKQELQSKIQDRYRHSKTFENLTIKEINLFIEMMLDKNGEQKWNFIEDIKGQEKLIEQVISE